MNLGDYVTGSFIQKTQKFSSTPKLIPVQVYVEGNEDVFFWKKVLKKYERKYFFSVVTNKTATGGSNGKDALTQIKNLHLNKIICVDADFDLLIDGYHPYTSTIRDNSFIIHTEYYSIENILGQGCSLKSLIQSISNMESTFNFDDFGIDFVYPFALNDTVSDGTVTPYTVRNGMKIYGLSETIAS